MKLLPLHRFEIGSRLDRQAALAAISTHTEREKLLRLRWPSSANDNRFEGQISVDGFHIRRITGCRNSFLPVVDGVVQASGRGSRIKVRMRMFILAHVLAAAWTIAVGRFLFTDIWPLALGMLAFMYALAMGGFWYEASKQERVLRQIFQAR